MNNIPSVRFKGFSESWKEMRLGEVVDLQNGFAFKSKYFTQEHSIYIVLTPGNVNIGGGFQSGKGHFYDNTREYPSKFILEPNDIFVTMTDLTPSSQTLGYPALIPKDGKVYLLNQRLGKLIDFQGDKRFLFNLLSTNKYRNQIVTSASGTTVKHSSPQKILGSINFFPKESEQTQIGNFFLNLDQLISLHQKKYDKLVILKKAMLEKMFPKLGSNLPEIRFKGFEGDWEEKKVGDITDSYSGGTPFVGNRLFYGGSIPFIRSGEINSKSTELFLSELGLKNSSAKLVNKGDVLFALYGATSGEVGISNIAGAINQAIMALKPKKDFSSFFLAYWLRQQKTFIVNTFLQGGQGNLSGNIVKELMIQVPEYSEQLKIGDYFQNLDNLISLNQKQLEKLKNIKKACLEKMFV